ncbi:MarR family winged helix-turn-helix transcriptional regulator [[Clostridium] polysaccharolyticum]|uniref:Winged helix DNA-binding domain-containing protein n=1 Tax=[Clostridium] polysaccharolyticum TaxID=29364 RepID=A0A1H9YBB8_9FIRM|nr:winged helix DNA-binding protein [[Clostridium] polysaccharolyticum]SES65770.1 Winged helix DNA-binding domain-containing protein [[Clostridium] polysaccharolyticum]
MEKKYDEFLELIHSFKRTTCKIRSSSLAPAVFMTLIAIQHLSLRNQEKERGEGVKVSDISQYLETSKSDVSKKIRLLEEKDLITRFENRQDKRITFVQITANGIEALRQNKEQADRFLTNVFDRMGEEDMNQFMLLCSKMREAMEEEIKNNEERKKQV